MRIGIGDVFAITTSHGEGYLQFVYKDDQGIEFLRVMPGLYKSNPDNLGEIVEQKERYVIGFPLGAAYRKKIVDRVGNFPIPDWFQMPQLFRSAHMVRGEFLGWHIIDRETWRRELVERLSAKERELSPWEIWNDTMLKERLVENWSLEMWGLE